MGRRTSAFVGSVMACVTLLPVQTLAQPSDPRSVATGLWAKLLTKCGDTYYTGAYSFDDGRTFSLLEKDLTVPGPMNSNDIAKAATEYKGVSFVVAPMGVTQADKLNGIAWHGYMQVFSTSWRTVRTTDGVWSDWQDSDRRRPEAPFEPVAGSFSVEVMKQNGVWLYGSAGAPIERIRAVKPSCNDARRIGR
jgi:hypothetical protein